MYHANANQTLINNSHKYIPQKRSLKIYMYIYILRKSENNKYGIAMTKLYYHAIAKQAHSSFFLHSFIKYPTCIISNRQLDKFLCLSSIYIGYKCLCTNFMVLLQSAVTISKEREISIKFIISEFSLLEFIKWGSF